MAHLQPCQIPTKTPKQGPCSNQAPARAQMGLLSVRQRAQRAALMSLRLPNPDNFHIAAEASASV